MLMHPVRVNGRECLDALWARGRAFLGTEFAILGGAMSWISERNLVAATSNAGGFGVLACGAMTPELLEAEIEAAKAMTSRPFGVNLITLHPRFLELIDVAGRMGVSHTVFAGGIPSGEAIARAKSYGAKVICFAPALVLAKRLVRAGADALIIEGSEAGGHIGPVSLSVLAQEILPEITDVPVFVAGGIGRGEAMAAYLEMGASGIQIGTRLVCAHECTAHPNFKKAFLRAPAREAQATVQIDPRFPVIPVRAIRNKSSALFIEAQKEAIAAFDSGAKTLEEAQMDIEHYWAGALRRAVVEGDVEYGSLMAGQSVGLVTKEQPLAGILGELIEQAVAYLERRKA